MFPPVILFFFAYQFPKKQTTFAVSVTDMKFEKKSSESLGQKSIDEVQQEEKLRVYLLLDNVRSAYNVGSIFRTADGFGVKKIFLVGISATPPHKEIFKTSLGATESVEWEYFKNIDLLVSKLEYKNLNFIGIEQTKNSTPLRKYEYPSGAICLVFGNEITGVSDEVLDYCQDVIEIPQFGMKHSFNVSVACGIVLWDWVSKKKQKCNLSPHPRNIERLTDKT